MLSSAEESTFYLRLSVALLYFLSSSLCPCLYTCLCNKETYRHAHTQTHAMTNCIINRSHCVTQVFAEPLNSSLSWPARRMPPLFNDTEGGNGFLFVPIQLHYCLHGCAALYWADKTTSCSNLLIFRFFYFLRWSHLPTCFYITPSSATVF